MEYLKGILIAVLFACFIGLFTAIFSYANSENLIWARDMFLEMAFYAYILIQPLILVIIFLGRK